MLQPAQPQPVRASLRYDSQPHRGLSVPSSQPIIVAIKDGPQLSGGLVDLDAFEFKTIFGPVSVPVNTILGIRMADDPRQPATVCLSNGDSLTGVLANDSVTIKTGWGGATIARDHIISIETTNEPVTWQQHDGRWKITVTAAEPLEGEAEGEDKSEPGKKEGALEPPSLIDPEDAPAASNTPLEPSATPKGN